MKKVIVIGSPGSGKSTFARKLRDKTGLPLYYLDMIWHKPDKTTVSREEFDERLGAILLGDSYIIDGNYSRTLERRFDTCDTVFFMDIGVEECLKGAEARIGKKREELPWIETEFSPEFREWILTFRERSLPKISALIEKYKNEKEIVIFKTREDADAYLEGISCAENGCYKD